MDFYTMQGEVFRRMEEDRTTPVRFSLLNVKASLNDANQEITSETECIERNYLFNLAAARLYYDLSDQTIFADDILSLRSIYNTQTGRWLELKTYRELDRYGPRHWQAQSGESVLAILRGLWQLGVTPQVAAAAGTFSIIYTACGADMVANTDSPEFPEEFHPGLVEHACYDLWCQVKQFRKAERYFENYLRYVEALRQYVDRRPSNAGTNIIGRG